MSDRDWDSSEWQLGMELPSRKDRHGGRKSKKKSDRKLETQPVGTPDVPAVQAPAPEPEHLEQPQPEPRVEPKTVTHRTYEAVPEDPKYAQPLTFEEEDATAERPKFEAVPAKPDYADRQLFGEVDEATECEPVLVSEQSATSSAEPVDDVPSDEQQDAVHQLQASWNESAATIAVPMGGTVEGVTSTVGSEMREDEQYLRDLLAQPEVSQELGKHGVQEELDQAAEDSGPVIAKWKIALVILLAPIVLVIILAWGKLAYVHQVPKFVLQQVPAYQTGQGFLILKPWWFGPTIFTLEQYPRTDGEDFVHWKIQLNDYEAVVQDPTVLYTFPEDILKK
ncbi:MAG: hypothetical protein ACXVDE_02795 [Tumebacillaceae bacterium]